MKFSDPFESFSETYTPIEPAISGGTGYVYKVLDSEGKPFALKMLKPEQIHKDRVKRFQQEIHFCQRFKHKNILSVVDSGFKDVKGTKCPFYVMAYYEHSLRDIISETHNSDQIIHIFSEILDGVEAIHLKDSWHRDLKPENILLNANLNDIVIADFGIAHFSEELLHTIIDTKPREKLLNISYSAPEQRNRSSNVDHRSDIFALGKILNEMFTKVVPEGTDFKKIETVDSNLSYLDDIVWKMIQNNPDSRYSSIEKIKYDLIGRKNEFINFQKVHSLEKTVIPSNFLDERLINPSVA